MSHSHPITSHPAQIEHENLRHHFEDQEQQREASSLGMWVFLATEIMFFGGALLGYLVYRMGHYAAWAAASKTLNMWIGMTNTLVLICSSLTMALSVRAAAVGARKALVILLIVTMIFGVAFLAIKGYEWHEKFVEHHVPGSNFNWEAEMPAKAVQETHAPAVNPREAELFFSFYFTLTGLHALHMVIGVAIVAWITWWAYKGKYTPEYHNPVENAGLYWHFVDIVWIFLFPLLYLIDRHH